MTLLQTSGCGLRRLQLRPDAPLDLLLGAAVQRSQAATDGMRADGCLARLGADQQRLKVKPLPDNLPRPISLPL
jgi:hypothetical protein